MIQYTGRRNNCKFLFYYLYNMKWWQQWNEISTVKISQLYYNRYVHIPKRINSWLWFLCQASYISWHYIPTTTNQCNIWFLNSPAISLVLSFTNTALEFHKSFYINKTNLIFAKVVVLTTKPLITKQLLLNKNTGPYNINTCQSVQMSLFNP